MSIDRAVAVITSNVWFVGAMLQPSVRWFLVMWGIGFFFLIFGGHKK